MDESRLYQIPILCRPPLCDVPQWATTRHYLKSTSSMYSYEMTPFFEEPSHYMSDLSGTSAVILKTPAQSGKTLSIMNFLGWMAEYYPSNTLLVLDSLKSGARMSHNRIRPFLREICGINNPKTKSQNPDRSNSVVNIGLRSGASLFVVSAKSASDSKSTPARFCLMDEIDAYPDDINGEGDPIVLFTQRLKRFRGMIIMTSTPTTEEGRITQNWRLGTAQTWGVICNCGEWMNVKYSQIDYSNDIPTFSCPHCGEVYDEEGIIKLKHCYNSPTNPTPLTDAFGRIRRSYEVTAPLCHSFVNWKSLKQQEIAALAIGESSYKSFKNTVLGESYKPKDDIEFSVPDLMRLSVSAYLVPDCIPSDIAFITCGIDTHDNCLYCETCGFSEDLKRMYGLDYSVLVGDPNEKEVWNSFEERFNRIYTRDDGKMIRPAFAFCDSGGHRTNSVYMYSYRNKRFVPIKGFVSQKANAVDPLLGKLTKLKMNAGLKGKASVQYIGVNAGKDTLAQMEMLTITGDKRLFYPRGCGYDTEYFKGLLSEKKICGRWIAPQGGHTDNEPLDTRVYAYAAASFYLQKYYITGKDRESIDGVSLMARKKKAEIVEEEIKEEKKEDKKKADKQEKPAIPEKKPVEKPQNNFPHW